MSTFCKSASGVQRLSFVAASSGRSTQGVLVGANTSDTSASRIRIGSFEALCTSTKSNHLPDGLCLLLVLATCNFLQAALILTASCIMLACSQQQCVLNIQQNSSKAFFMHKSCPCRMHRCSCLQPTGTRRLTAAQVHAFAAAVMSRMRASSSDEVSNKGAGKAVPSSKIWAFQR